MRPSCIMLLTLALAFVTVRADEPLSVPARQVTVSKNQRFRVVADPKVGTKCYDTRDEKLVWSTPRWFRKLIISDDGHHMATEYDGLNLIPEDYDGKMVMITFWSDGRIVREVTLDELIPDKKILRKTVSHYEWGSLGGFTDDGTVGIRLVDNTIAIYDPINGKRVEQVNRGKGGRDR